MPPATCVTVPLVNHTGSQQFVLRIEQTCGQNQTAPVQRGQLLLGIPQAFYRPTLLFQPEGLSPSLVTMSALSQPVRQPIVASVTQTGCSLNQQYLICRPSLSVVKTPNVSVSATSISNTNVTSVNENCAPQVGIRSFISNTSTPVSPMDGQLQNDGLLRQRTSAFGRDIISSSHLASVSNIENVGNTQNLHGRDKNEVIIQTESLASATVFKSEPESHRENCQNDKPVELQIGSYRSTAKQKVNMALQRKPEAEVVKAALKKSMSASINIKTGNGSMTNTQSVKDASEKVIPACSTVSVKNPSPICTNHSSVHTSLDSTAMVGNTESFVGPFDTWRVTGLGEQKIKKSGNESGPHKGHNDEEDKNISSKDYFVSSFKSNEKGRQSRSPIIQEHLEARHSGGNVSPVPFVDFPARIVATPGTTGVEAAIIPTCSFQSTNTHKRNSSKVVTHINEEDRVSETLHSKRNSPETGFVNIKKESRSPLSVEKSNRPLKLIRESRRNLWKEFLPEVLMYKDSTREIEDSEPEASVSEGHAPNHTTELNIVTQNKEKDGITKDALAESCMKQRSLTGVTTDCKKCETDSELPVVYDRGAVGSDCNSQRNVPKTRMVSKDGSGLAEKDSSESDAGTSIKRGNRSRQHTGEQNEPVRFKLILLKGNTVFLLVLNFFHYCS